MVRPSITVESTRSQVQRHSKEAVSMQIRTRMGISVDGFIATPDGRPAFLAMPDFVPHNSYGWSEFNEQIDAVVMGRVGLDAGLHNWFQNNDWPWPGKQIYVLTSRAVPRSVPADVVIADETPSGLVEKLRAADLSGDAFLLGGQRTLNAFLTLGAIDRLELLQLPVLLGEGIPFSLAGSPLRSLQLQQQYAFPDGTIQHVYTICS
jgi:dihydrofolate reductase